MCLYGLIPSGIFPLPEFGSSVTQPFFTVKYINKGFLELLIVITVIS